jgi:hypothetical protein
MTDQNTNFFRPRDVGCNRYELYDENGEYLGDRVKNGFEFNDFTDLKQKLVELLELKLYDHLYITEDGRVINGLCIGYVETVDKEFKEFLDKMDSSTPKHIQNELIRSYLMERKV